MKATAEDVCRTLVRLYVVGVPAKTLRGLIMLHGHTDDEAHRAMSAVRAEGFATIDTDGVWHLAEGVDQVAEEIPANYLAAADAYRRARCQPVSLRTRIADLWSKFLERCGFAFALLIATSCFAIGLCAQDVPAWVLRGIAAVETGVHWNDTGDVRGTWSKSTSGDVGPWHVSPAVLRDLRISDKATRIHRDVVLAESITRLWLLHLYRTTGCWHQTCAAWRAGLDGRHRAYARDYAERAFNYGTTY